MITESQIYWITRLTSFKVATIIFGLFLIMVWVVCWLMCHSLLEELKEKAAKKLAIVNCFTWLVPFLFLFGSAFIPTTKEMCAIKIIPVIANNEQVQELPSQIVELAGEWIEELKPKKE